VYSSKGISRLTQENVVTNTNVAVSPGNLSFFEDFLEASLIGVSLVRLAPVVRAINHHQFLLHFARNHETEIHVGSLSSRWSAPILDVGLNRETQPRALMPTKRIWFIPSPRCSPTPNCHDCDICSGPTTSVDLLCYDRIGSLGVLGRAYLLKFTLSHETILPVLWTCSPSDRMIGVEFNASPSLIFVNDLHTIVVDEHISRTALELVR